MVEVIRQERKGPILTPSAIPCLRRLPTINITQGCALGCVYCYTRGYRGYPGPGRVVLFTNTASLVAEELRRKRSRPGRVYFSPSSDAFQYVPGVQQVTYDTMHVLLDAGVEVAFLTKGYVTRRFLDLFEKHAGLVHAQIGITSLDHTLRRCLEPRTAPPRYRIQTMHTLASIGCRVTARLDPLIPDVTDTPLSIEPLLEAVAATGVRLAAASYIFLRPAFRASAVSILNRLNPDQRPGEWTGQQFTDGCGGGQCIGEEERRERFRRLADVGRRFGITIAPCHCKNPGLADGSCHIAGRAEFPGPPLSQPLLPFASPSPADSRPLKADRPSSPCPPSEGDDGTSPSLTV